jgi:hypothetical protein
MKLLLLILTICILSCNNDADLGKCEYTINQEQVKQSDRSYQLCDNGVDTVGLWVYEIDRYNLYDKDSAVINSFTHP